MHDSLHKARSLARYFEVSLLCTLATAFFTLASTARLDRPTVVLFSAALLARLLILARRVEWSLNGKWVTALSIGYLAFYPLDLLYLSSGSNLPERMLLATVHLALFGSAIKVLSASGNRDYIYLALLSFVMMLAAAILTVAALYIAGFCVYVVFAVSTLMSYEVLRTHRQRAVPERPKVEDQLADSGAIQALELALGRATLGLMVALVPLAVLLFFAIPRYRSGYWWRTGYEPQRITGFTESVDLGDIGKILRSDRVIMRVTPEGDVHSFEGVKLRGVALSSFNGQHWWNADRAEYGVMPTSVDTFLPPDFTGLATRRSVQLRYRVLLEPLSSNVLFIAGRALQINVHMHYIVADHAGSMLDPLHPPGTFQYEVISEPEPPSWRDLRKASSEIPKDIRETYLGLPPLDPRIARLSRQITSGSLNNYDRAVALQSYLQSHFTYSLDMDLAARTDPVASFLFESKHGNCEFFAAAMAVMLRSLGIGSRLVNGFQIGDYNPVGKDFVVRGYDAHSWVEVYFPGLGWVPFDPTPAGSQASAHLSVLQSYLDAAQLFWTEWVVNYDAGAQLHLASALESTSRDFDRRFRAVRWKFGTLTEDRAAAALNWLRVHRINVLAFIIIVLALATLAVRNPDWVEELWTALGWRLASRRTANPARTATIAYKRFLIAMARRGYQKASEETPLEFAATLGDSDSALRGAAIAFTILYQSARFGHRASAPAAIEAALDVALTAAAASSVR